MWGWSITTSAPSDSRPSDPRAAAPSWNAPGRTPRGSVRVTAKLRVSSSRWKERLSAARRGQPAGGVATTWARAGPRPRFVTVSVKRRAPLPAPLVGPPRRAREFEAVEPDHRVPRVPHGRLDLDPLPPHDDAVIRDAVERHAGRGRERDLERDALPRVRGSAPQRV